MKLAIILLAFAVIAILYYFLKPDYPNVNVKGFPLSTAEKMLTLQGFVPVVMAPNEPWTRNFVKNRVRLIVDPDTQLVTNSPQIG